MFKHSINSNSTIVDILRELASQQPEKMAYAFLQEGKTIKDSWTYSQLNQRAIAIAATLQSQIEEVLRTESLETGFFKGNSSREALIPLKNPVSEAKSVNSIKSKSRVLLIYPAGLEFLAAFFGCLYAGVIAIPAPAPEMFGKQRIVARIKAIIDDAKPAILLTTSETYPQLDKLKEQIFINYKPKILTTENLPIKQNYQLLKPAVSIDDIAYLQYTSGSTSTPKGVEITHKCLMANLGDAIAALGYNSESIVANWMPHFHDAGLVGGLLRPLYAGIPCYVMSPLALMKQPIRWLEIISNYRITHSIGTNFIYDYCVSHAKPELCQNLNLSGWQVAGVGAEPIRHETLNSFVEIFKPYGFESTTFCPGYGLAESTLTLTAKSLNNMPLFLRVSAEALKKNQVLETSKTGDPVIVGCGSFIGNTKIAIVNPQTLTRCAADEIGEIWVAGSSIAKGYWNRPDISKQTFQAYITDTKEGPFLRTGDLGFIKNGELFVSGRLKDLIIIRGHNYYPQDIEWIVEKSHPAVRINCCAAFSIEINKVEQLVIAAEIEGFSNKNLALDEVVKAIRKAVAEHHELAVYGVVLLKRSTILKTSSGKIQRQACRAAYLDGSLDSIACWTLDIATSEEYAIPQNEYEFRLMQIWQQVLEINTIGIKDNFFEWGGNSLKAAEIIAQIERKFNQNLPISALLENPTIEELAAKLNQPEWGQKERSLVAIKPGGSKRPFFYVHPRSGTLLLAGNLGRYIDAERPFYGLQSIGLDGKQEPFTRIEDMAAHYIKEIQTIQPIGPYLIGGRCIGGLIALEMAQQLLAQGKKVLGLIIVETPRTRILDPALAQQIQKNMKKMRESNSDQANFFQKVMNANDQAGHNYQPKVYSGSITYFSALETIHDSASAFGWDQLAGEGVEIVQVPGNHMSVTEEPNVRVFAQKLNIFLDEAERKNRSFQLQQIQADLEISRNRLSQIKGGL